jgi:hypothetical protein
LTLEVIQWENSTGTATVWLFFGLTHRRPPRISAEHAI